jgi:hypothetical protein
MNTLREKRLDLFAILSLLMAATRFDHTGSQFALPDASWAVFFLGGFYLARQWRWAFPVLLLQAVLIDLVSIRYFGVSNYCVTPAYWFIVPSYAALWLGGRWLQARFTASARGFALAVAGLLAAFSLCFVISNGSFYWLGGRVADADLAGWRQNLGDWYLSFLASTFGYAAAAALAHALVLQLKRLSQQGAVGNNR